MGLILRSGSAPSRLAAVLLGALLLLALPGCPSSEETVGDDAGGGVSDTGGGDTSPCLQGCEWRECGPDPVCGGSCGTCGDGEHCDKGSCIPDGCVPDCSAVECGVDPVCGAYCAGCPDGEFCQEGQCVPGTCTPECGARECGPDPVCFESCGTCDAGYECRDGACVEDVCVAECGTRECGPDPLCGESCGDCGDGEQCRDGQCVATCVPDCSEVECGPDPVCGMDCGGCIAEEQCVDGACVPIHPYCEGRECGVNPVTGESCGECGDGFVCSPDGLCDPVQQGACVNEQDLAILNSVDAVELATTCVLDANCGVDAVCIGGCIESETGLSDGCAGCYGELGACGVTNCLGACMGGGDSPECRGCLDENCIPAFELCAGVREVPCEPECGARECGPDPLCGQSCGMCEPGSTCSDEGRCVPDGGDGACNNPEDLERLNGADVVAVGTACVLDSGCGVERGCLSECIQEQTGISGGCAECYGDLAACGLESCLGSCFDDFESPTCTACVEDACLADFEACSGVTWEICEPACDAQECGLDPVCGVSCGECEDGMTCRGGRCVDGPCVPACGERECGPDPVCGESCGVCDEGAFCDALGQCRPSGGEGACNNDEDLSLMQDLDAVAVAQTCVFDYGCMDDQGCFRGCIVEETGLSADCAVCWADLAGCGLAYCLGECMNDQGGEACIACLEESCLDDFEVCAGVTWECVPQCEGRECGSDGCGGSCGGCDDGLSCREGQCVPPTQEGACNNDEDLALLNDVDIMETAQLCLLEWGCGIDAACISGCVAEVTGVSDGCAACYGGLAECGLDACLTDCLNDPGGDVCMACLEDACFPEFEQCAGVEYTGGGSCVPQCDGVECGSDGCGGSCGECAAGEACTPDGMCLPLPEGQACNNDSDMAALGDPALGTTAQNCLMGGCSLESQCVADCLTEETGLSPECALCVSDGLLCIVNNCLAQCLPDSSSPECMECAYASCGESFTACAGVEFVIPF